MERGDGWTQCKVNRTAEAEPEVCLEGNQSELDSYTFQFTELKVFERGQHIQSEVIDAGTSD